MKMSIRTWWHIYVEHRLECYGPMFDQSLFVRFVRLVGRSLYVARRYIEGARSVDCSRDSRGALLVDGLDIEWGGNCPVQGDGTVGGRVCYYRSRGEGWQFHVAPIGSDDVFAKDAWVYSERKYVFPDGGWVSSDVSRRCILKAFEKFKEAEPCSLSA